MCVCLCVCLSHCAHSVCFVCVDAQPAASFGRGGILPPQAMPGMAMQPGMQQQFMFAPGVCFDCVFVFD